MGAVDLNLKDLVRELENSKLYFQRAFDCLKTAKLMIESKGGEKSFKKNSRYSYATTKTDINKIIKKYEKFYNESYSAYGYLLIYALGEVK